MNKGYEIDQDYEVMVQHQFTDSISDIKIKVSGTNYFMAVSSWDGQIQMFQLGPNPSSNRPQVQPINAPVQTEGPILGICFEADTQMQMSQFNPNPPQKSMIVYIAHSDGTIKRWDPTQNGSKPSPVGQH
jgi:WD40 repeat protein